jgi:polyhydroxybutyrate depolymerase
MSNRMCFFSKKALGAVFLLSLALSAYSFDSISLTVEDIKRDALIHLPANGDIKTAPVIVVYHGHGGNMNASADKFHLETYWPEAIVIYPQGLNTPTASDPEGKKPGWQRYVGDQGDRDIKFFDALVEYLKKNYLLEGKRVFATGFSNGGRMAYMLLAERGESLAAVASVAGVLYVKDDFKRLQPKPIFHVAGKKDDTIKYATQKETIEYFLKLNKCKANGKKINEYLTEYPSTSDNLVMTYVHNGGHEIPSDSLPFIVEFFKRY